MIRVWAMAVVVGVCSVGGHRALAQSAGNQTPRRATGANETIEAAQTALATGDYDGAAGLAEALARNPRRTSADRAEAYRILGLARFFAGDRAGAKRAFEGYVRLDPEAHLDPALVPPEAIVVLEEVRVEHAAEVRAARPRPHRRVALNFVPPFGQFQNGQKLKGGLVAGAELAFLATNLTAYGILRSWCQQDDGTCPGHHDSADLVRTINIVAFAGLATTYFYGVIDGLVVMRRLEQDERVRVSVVPTDGGAAVGIVAHF